MTLKELSECQKQTNMGAAGIAVRGLVALTLNEAEAGFLVSQPAHAGGVFWDVLQTCLFSLKGSKERHQEIFPYSISISFAIIWGTALNPLPTQ